MINYDNLFFKTGNPIIKIFDFLKRFGTLFDLFTNLLDKKINTFRAAEEQKEMINKLEELKKIIVLLEKESIIKNKTHKKNKFLQYKTVF